METIICHTAGESKGNPGPSVIAIHISNEKGEVIQEIAKSIGNASAPFAHYNAVMVCLQALQSFYGEETKTLNFNINLDSELVAQHLNSKSPINDPGLVPMFIEIHNMRVTSFPHLVVTLVTRADNSAALNLLKGMLDGK